MTKRSLEELEALFLHPESGQTLEEHYGCEVSVGLNENPITSLAASERTGPPAPTFQQRSAAATLRQQEFVGPPAPRAPNLHMAPATWYAVQAGENPPWNTMPVCEGYVRVILRTCCYALKLKPALLKRAEIWGSERQQYGGPNPKRHPLEEHLVIRGHGDHGPLFTAQGGAGFMLVITPTDSTKNREYTMNWHGLESVDLVDHVQLIGNVSNEPQPYQDGTLMWYPRTSPKPRPPHYRQGPPER